MGSIQVFPSLVSKGAQVPTVLQSYEPGEGVREGAGPKASVGGGDFMGEMESYICGGRHLPEDLCGATGAVKVAVVASEPGRPGEGGELRAVGTKGARFEVGYSDYRRDEIGEDGG